jgi:tricorn protease
MSTAFTRRKWASNATSLMFLLVAACIAHAETPPPSCLLREPTLSSSEVALSCAGFIWIVGRNGGQALQVTHGGHEGDPHLSPDGTLIAFAGSFDGQRAIYIIPVKGGIPKRLTFHPADIAPVGWTRDGSSVLFTSGRGGFAPWPDENMRLFKVSKQGGAATPLPFHRASAGSLSPNQKRIAYVPNVAWQHFQDAWKRYRGGQTQTIWIARLSDSHVEDKIPRNNSNDFNPMWIGDSIYFLSDRAGLVSLFSYDLRSKQVRQVVENHGFDIKSASAFGNMIIYDEFDSLHLLDTQTGANRTLDILSQGDFQEIRPQAVSVDAKEIKFAKISSAGDHVALGVHGEILTLELSDAQPRNWTSTTAVSEIDPAWSPDGRAIAYFSDESGAYALHIRTVDEPRPKLKIPLGDPIGFYYNPTWSPDAQKIAYSDQHLNYWYVDISHRIPVRLDTDLYAGPDHTRELAWSPDGLWIAYTKQLESHFHAVFIYSLAQKKTYQLTDGQADALHVAFAPSGDILYFTASTDLALAAGWLNMSAYERPVSRQVYAVALDSRAATKLARLTSDDQGKSDSRSPGSPQTSDNATRVDIDGIEGRIVTLPISSGNYRRLWASVGNSLYLLKAATVVPLSDDEPEVAVQRWDLSARRLESVVDSVAEFDLAADGHHGLYKKDNHWFVQDLGGGAVARQLPLDTIKIEVDPRPEWRHMFEQVWRNERSFFYDPNLQGLDWEATRKRYEPFLEHISSREDLNYLLLEMLGNLRLSHIHARGGDIPQVEEKTPVGLLGADYTVEHGRYRVTRVYPKDLWDVQMRSPLTDPGSEVREGEFILAVNGHQAMPSADLLSYFVGTAGQATRLLVGPHPDISGSRTVTVVPIADDATLRHFAWVEKNRHTVDSLSNGQIAYVFVPNTAARGYRSFNREYFAQVGKRGVIVDNRYDHGGDIADYMTDVLGRPLRSRWHLREGKDLTDPMEGIFGPKAMLINEMAGSGGDAVAWKFRDAKLGPLIGKRTWGGLVGHYTAPDDLLDGAYVAAPNSAFYNLKGAWEVENHGVDPDIEVEDDPEAERLGHDPQLEKAIGWVMQELKTSSPATSTHPPYPKYAPISE